MDHPSILTARPLIPSGPGLIIPGGVVGGQDIDPEIERKVRLMLRARIMGRFAFIGSALDAGALFFRRFTGLYVDLMVLVLGDTSTSGAIRYERRGYPWPKDEEREALLWVEGSIEDVVSKVLEWQVGA